VHSFRVESTDGANPSVAIVREKLARACDTQHPCEESLPLSFGTPGCAAKCEQIGAMNVDCLEQERRPAHE
jgi:hypothetical protein